jgi:hypothetical protein
MFSYQLVKSSLLQVQAVQAPRTSTLLTLIYIDIISKCKLEQMPISTCRPPGGSSGGSSQAGYIGMNK